MNEALAFDQHAIACDPRRDHAVRAYDLDGILTVGLGAMSEAEAADALRSAENVADREGGHVILARGVEILAVYRTSRPAAPRP